MGVFDAVGVQTPTGAIGHAFLWFPLYGPQHDLIHWLARPLPKYGENKFVAPTGSNGSLWIPPETYAVAKHVSVPLVVTEGPANPHCSHAISFDVFGKVSEP